MVGGTIGPGDPRNPVESPPTSPTNEVQTRSAACGALTAGVPSGYGIAPAGRRSRSVFHVLVGGSLESTTRTSGSSTAWRPCAAGDVPGVVVLVDVLLVSGQAARGTPRRAGGCRRRSLAMATLTQVVAGSSPGCVVVELESNFLLVLGSGTYVWWGHAHPKRACELKTLFERRAVRATKGATYLDRAG